MEGSRVFQAKAKEGKSAKWKKGGNVKPSSESETFLLCSFLLLLLGV